MMTLTYRVHTARGWEGERTVQVTDDSAEEGGFAKFTTAEGALLEVPSDWIQSLQHNDERK